MTAASVIERARSAVLGRCTRVPGEHYRSLYRGSESCPQLQPDPIKIAGFWSGSEVMGMLSICVPPIRR